jgi:hypothetical protein
MDRQDANTLGDRLSSFIRTGNSAERGVAFAVMTEIKKSLPIDLASDQGHDAELDPGMTANPAWDLNPAREPNEITQFKKMNAALGATLSELAPKSEKELASSGTYQVLKNELLGSNKDTFQLIANKLSDLVLSGKSDERSFALRLMSDIIKHMPPQVITNWQKDGRLAGSTLNLGAAQKRMISQWTRTFTDLKQSRPTQLEMNRAISTYNLTHYFFLPSPKELEPTDRILFAVDKPRIWESHTSVKCPEYDSRRTFS